MTPNHFTVNLVHAFASWKAPKSYTKRLLGHRNNSSIATAASSRIVAAETSITSELNHVTEVFPNETHNVLASNSTVGLNSVRTNKSKRSRYAEGPSHGSPSIATGFADHNSGGTTGTNPHLPCPSSRIRC